MSPPPPDISGGVGETTRVFGPNGLQVVLRYL